MAPARNKLWLIVGVIVIAAGALFLYRFSTPVVQQVGTTSAPQTQDIPDLAIAREVNAVASYETPGGTDKVRFTLSLDSEGAIVDVKTTDVLNGEAVSENLQKFSQGLLLLIRGKTLSELKSIDRVGKSSLTTAAYNSALPDLQKQL
ncbi:MAG: hypothetical protein Q7S01_04895 [bacterium]|nr:hypothetical protein [bacterium]